MSGVIYTKRESYVSLELGEPKGEAKQLKGQDQCFVE